METYAFGLFIIVLLSYYIIYYYRILVIVFVFLYNFVLLSLDNLL